MFTFVEYDINGRGVTEKTMLRGLIWKLAVDRHRLAEVLHDKYELTKHMLSGSDAIQALFLCYRRC
jgi:hypothetical protein